MKLKVSVFEYLNQKVMYIQDVNYYFGIRDNFDIKLGDYELSEEEVLNIAKENDPEEYEVFINTSIEERLNKINTFNIEDVKQQSTNGQFTLCLHPSRKCNLNCKYCFRESEYLGNDQLTFEVAKDAIDFLVDKYAPYASKYVVDLSGSGEPLLQIDLVKQIVEYCKKKRNEICKNIEVMFCTNLTLLTPEMVDYLDNEPAIILGTSIDGDQITNDNNRMYANGKGTYDDIIKGLKMFKNKKLGLAVTITPLNQDIDLIYDHLYHLPNIDCISMSFIRCFDDSEFNISNFDAEYLSKRYTLLCEKILKELNNNNFDYLEKLLNGADIFGNYIIQSLFKNFKNIYKCDAGKNRIAVNDKGDVFACSVMMGNQDFLIGNIYKEITIERQEFFFTPQTLNPSCKNCSVSNICGGECYANSYLLNSNMFTLAPNMCDIKKLLIKLAIAVVNKIKLKQSHNYLKLMELVMKIQYYYQTDTSIWAITEYLKQHNIKTDYENIIRNIVIEAKGLSPIGMLQFLQLILDCNAYKLEVKYNIVNKDFPAICFINKQKNIRYNYMIIDKIENELVYFHDMTSNDNIPYDEFINNISNIIII